MRAIGRYLHANLLGALALFVALGGTGYAAIAIPRSSVGTPQLRNGAVTPAKLAGRQIAGSIYAWAYIDANGKVLAAHGLRPGVVRGRDGQYGFAVKNQGVPRGCAAVASVASTLFSGRAPGSAVATLSTRRSPTVAVNTFSATGQAAQLPFVVEVLC
jgi:hypothetical protein